MNERDQILLYFKEQKEELVKKKKIITQIYSFEIVNQKTFEKVGNSMILKKNREEFQDEF